MPDLLRRFLSDCRGSVALMLGIAAIPVFGLMGAAIDYNRASAAQMQLSAALDSAALALARSPLMPESDARQYLESYLQDQLSALGYHGSWQITEFNQDQNRVTAAAAGTLDSVMVGVIGVNKMDLGVNTVIVREQKKVELALVLDNTGSMAGSKITALRNAADALVQIMFAGQEAVENVKISLVPFVTGVNIRSPGAFSMAWMDVDAEAQYHGQNFDPTIGAPVQSSGGPGNGNSNACQTSGGNAAGCDMDIDVSWGGIVGSSGKVNHFKLFDRIANTEWAGCVEARPGDLALSDAPPSAADPDTLFVPWLWPDDPDNGSYSHRDRHFTNNYLDDIINSGPHLQRQMYVGKFQEGVTANLNEVPSENARGPNKSCARPIVPLTNDTALLRDEINAMQPWHNSGTNIAEGLAWGWRVLSPEEPFSQGVPYSDTDVLKAMVLLTDGTNDFYGGGNTVNNSQYTSYGYLEKKRLNTDSRTTAISRLNDRVGTLCQRVKEKEIRLYTITFQVSNNTLRDLFRGCATEPSLYFDNPDNTQLKSVFEQIAYDLSNLRIAE